MFKEINAKTSLKDAQSFLKIIIELNEEWKK